MADEEEQQQNYEENKQEEKQEEKLEEQQEEQNQGEEDQQQQVEQGDQGEEEQPQQQQEETSLPQKNYAPPDPTIKDVISLIQFLPVNHMDKNIEAISSVIYDYDELHNEFLQKVDNRTTISKDDPKGEFICCEHNRDGDSYRSPISNTYYPPQDDGRYPSKALRNLEEKLNTIFQLYTKTYYSSTCHFSAYCWDLGESIQEGFGVAVLIKNSTSHSSINEGTWDSNNVITVKFNEKNGKIYADYNLITTVTLTMAFSNKICGNVDLSGTVSRSAHASKLLPKGYYDEGHVESIGMLVEDLETNIRNSIENIYVMKSKEIIDTARENQTMGKSGIAQAEQLKNAFKSSQK